jgi:ubiquinone/menaquinone biosynthesis C-methylase UbiE
MAKIDIGTQNELSRRAWLKRTLEGLSEGSTILDAGAGELANKVYCQHLKYTSQDFCQYTGTGDSKSLQVGSWNTDEIDIVSDITKIPVEDHSFDSILCSEVIEHLPYPERSIEELHRILKPGGQMIITAPFCSLTHFSPYHYSSGFNSYFYQYHLGRLGYEIEELVPNGDYFSFIAQELRRIPQIAQTYANSEVSLLDNFFINQVLKLLTRLRKNDQKSHELLCYGYHVRARKK